MISNRLVATYLLVAALIGPVAADDRLEYSGRRLADVLEELQQQGLNLVFSSALVGPELTVAVEPRSTDPRLLLEEILAPHGLAVRTGPGRSLLVGRANDPAFRGPLRGRVTSADHGTPVVGATVRRAGAARETTTRPDGGFELPGITAGAYTVEIEAPGFVTRSLPGVRVRPDDPPELIVLLEAQATFVTEIVVNPSRLSVLRQSPSASLSVSSDDVLLAPTIGGDVSRVIELLPGVSAPDNTAAFSIRGSEPRDVALLLDGLELYEPFHLQSFQSPFSLVDNEIVERIDFLGGGFTADLGDRHGGVVKISTLVPGNPHRTAIQLGTVNTRFAHASPLANGSGSWLASVRAWYPQSIHDTLELGESGLDPQFQDSYLKLTFNVTPRTLISAHGLMSHERIDFNEDMGIESVTVRNRTAYLWARALRGGTGGSFSETVLSAGRISRRRNGISDPEDVVVVVNDNRRVNFLGLKHDTTWRLSDSQLLKVGGDLRWLDAQYRYANTLPAGGTTTRSLGIDPVGTSGGVYLAHRASVSESLATEVGLRWDRQSYTGDAQLSPRLNAIWRPGERTQIRVGFGRFFQSQRIHELRVEDGEDTFNQAELSRHAGLTFQHRFPGLRLRVDVYDRKLTRINPRFENLFNPVELFPEVEMDRELVDTDLGRFRGVELLLRSERQGRFNWWLSYARSSAKDRTAGADTPRRWDQPHAGRFVVDFRDRRWAASLSAVARSGWPTTPVTGMLVTLPGGGIEIEQVNGERNTARFPTYFRLDAKLRRSFEAGWGRVRLEAEIVNLTDRHNICCIDEHFFRLLPDGDVEVTREVHNWLGFTPLASVILEF